MAHLHSGARGISFVRQIQLCFGVVSTERVREQNDSQDLSAKIRTNEIQYTWLEGKERIVTDRRHEWKQPVAALHHGYQCISQAERFVLSSSPLLIPDKGSSMRHREEERNSVCEGPWG